MPDTLHTLMHIVQFAAFAVAAADLSLPGGQAGGLETLLGRFPGLHLTGDGSIRDRILRTMLHSAQPNLDYDEDVKPWTPPCPACLCRVNRTDNSFCLVPSKCSTGVSKGLKRSAAPLATVFQAPPASRSRT